MMMEQVVLSRQQPNFKMLPLASRHCRKKIQQLREYPNKFDFESFTTG